MSTRMRDMMARALGELRYEPTEKRVRAVIGGATIADSTRAVLVWEPMRVVPSYAFPAEEVRAELIPAPPATDARIPAHGILHPGIPFGVHSSEGQALSQVRIELEGEVLAESTRPSLLFETSLPVRFYLPPEDVRLERHASTRRTYWAAAFQRVHKRMTFTASA